MSLTETIVQLNEIHDALREIVKFFEKDFIEELMKRPKKLKPVKLKSHKKKYGHLAPSTRHPLAEYLNLPKMMVTIFNFNEKSSFGPENRLIVHLWLETHMGHIYMPVVHIGDNPETVDYNKALHAHTPAAQNYHVLKKDEFQVQTHGNIFFAGWTKPISLLNGKYTLPPSCLLFEGYGNVKPGILRVTFPSGREEVLEYNGLEAFVTFFHPSSKYSGPGTDGVLSRELVITSYPSMNKEKLHPKREVE